MTTIQDRHIKTESGFSICWSLDESRIYLMDDEEDCKHIEISFYNGSKNMSKELKIHILEGIIKSLKQL